MSRRYDLKLALERDPENTKLANAVAYATSIVDGLSGALETLRCLIVATNAEQALRARMVVAPPPSADEARP